MVRYPPRTGTEGHRRVNATAPHDPLEARDRPARLTVGVVGAGRVGP
ncbi:oxidoreductase, partial [Streptomyces sp. Wh19]|nr:oxidoreductase [Streptomyces sp. Wh19]